MGTNVSLAARIEPVTPPGKVYCSQTFAALSVTEGVQDFVCAYVGEIPLHKDAGTLPLYDVKPRSSTARKPRHSKRAD